MTPNLSVNLGKVLIRSKYVIYKYSKKHSEKQTGQRLEPLLTIDPPLVHSSKATLFYITFLNPGYFSTIKSQATSVQ